MRSTVDTADAVIPAFPAMVADHSPTGPLLGAGCAVNVSLVLRQVKRPPGVPWQLGILIDAGMRELTRDRGLGVRRLAPMWDVRRAVLRHLPMLCLLAAGAVLRLLAFKAFYPALEYTDSLVYLSMAASFYPNGQFPVGYSVLLNGLSHTGYLASVTLVQHLMGLLVGVLLYVLLCRNGVRPWLAALGAAPLILDAYQIDIEQFVLSEALAGSLLALAAALLLWRDRPAPWQCAVGGLVLALAGLTRTALLPLVLPAALFVLLRRTSPRSLASALCLVGAFGLPVVAYSSWNQQVSGIFSPSAIQGRVLYGRVAPIADCTRLALTRTERNLCPAGTPGRRPGLNYFVWNLESPLYRPWPGVVPRCSMSSCPDLSVRDKVAQSFALEVIRQQPAAYLRMVLTDALRSFGPGRDDPSNENWVFPQDPHSRLLATVLFGSMSGGQVSVGHHTPSLANPSLAGDLGAYQRYAFTPGPLLGVFLLAGLVVGTGLVIPSAQQRRLRWMALTLAVLGAVVLIAPPATAFFDYRYVLPALVLLPPSAAAAGEVLLRTWGLGLPRFSGE